jgi:hypothetical protein
MTALLPFTLAPLEGEGLVAWLGAYAARLDVTPGELAEALGLPDRAGDPETGRGGYELAERHVERIRAATGLGEAVVRALLRPGSPAVEDRRGPDTSRERPTLSLVERLRHAATLGRDDRLRHATTICRQRRNVREADPAIERARRLPDQLWPAWAIRLADNEAFEPMTFRPSMLAALLVPHSALSLREVAALVSDRVQSTTVAHHLRKLFQVTGDATALQILTELAFAIDRHDLPIDYAQRRRLAAGSELIDRHTWASLARKAEARSGGLRRVRFAGCYLYEQLTGCNLHLAPLPYRIEGREERIEYHDFVAGLPQALVDLLHQHAEGLLASAGITDEPLQWQPPADWVTVTDWPGADPDQTGPDTIHRALLARRTPHSHLAASLGISTEHLRYVIRQHPRPCPGYPTRRALAPAAPAGEPTQPPGPKTVYLDPSWLRLEYLTWRRSLPDIATEIGCNVAVLKKFAHEHSIPLRPRSGPEGFAHLDAPGSHPSQLPEPLRSALTGQDPRQRLCRFVFLVDQPSLNQAAQLLGAHQSTLTQQIQQLERACGGLLLHRHPRPQPVGPLTPLGEQLHRQALEHLDLTPPPHETNRPC